MKQRLRIGVQLPEVEYVARWRDYLEMALIAEEIGLDSIWLGDHLLYREPGSEPTGPWECLSLLSALAAVTKRVELGPLVLAAGFRNPAVTAKMAETIDEISNGRLILGIGAGWNHAEFSAFGIPFDRRFARFAEWFDITCRLLREGAATYAGEFFQVDDCLILPGGPRAGHIPLMIGSTGERMLRHTLPHVDAWNIWFTEFGNTPAGVAPHVQRINRLCAELGRDVDDLSKSAAILVTSGDGGRRARKASGVQPISGTPIELAEQLAAFETAGIDHLQLVLDPINPKSIAALQPALVLLRELTA